MNEPKNNSINNLNKKFIKALASYDMLKGTDCLILGLSGGADSVSLLYLLNEYCRKSGLKLYAVHINHGIRGEEAQRDENFCIDICKKNDVTLFVEKIDVPALSNKYGTGLEETARNERYRIFEETAKKLNADCIATAHNADDNCETVLFNMIRGSGTKGLCGIPPKRMLNGIRVIRPLIYCSKDEITDYCRAINVDFCFDSTNSDVDYSRNYIRNKIIPLMKSINPSLCDSIGRMNTSLANDEEYLSREAEKYKEETRLDVLLSLHSSLLSRVIMNKFFSLTGESLSYKNVDDVMRLLNKRVNYSSVTLPKGFIAQISGNNLYIANHRVKISDAEDLRYEIKLSAGENIIYGNNASIHLLLSPTEKEIAEIKNFHKKSTQLSLMLDKICYNSECALTVRNRKKGDAIRFCGVTKKLKKLFNEKGIAVETRNSLPIVCLNDKPLWIPYIAYDDSVKEQQKQNCETMIKAVLIYCTD